MEVQGKRQPVQKAEVIEVIHTVCVIGEGVKENPTRYLHQYWGKDGELLAEKDDK